VKYYLETADSDWFKQRATGVMFFVAAAFVILFIRLFYLQVIEGEEYSRLSENNCIRRQYIDPPRGLIFDRNGNSNENLLVDNRPSFDLSIILRDAKPIKDTIEKLSGYIKVPKEEFFEKIASTKGRSSYKPVVLKRDIGRNALAAIEVHKFDLPGVVVDVKPRRYYIGRQSAAHLIGYLSEISAKELRKEKYSANRVGDFIGKFGVEKSHEEFLRGTLGGQQVEVDAKGQVVRILKIVDAQPGHNMFLTIDQKVQKKAEELLKNLAGAVVAMEPNTGHVLAMASSPSFDQNIFVDGMSHEQWDALASNPLRAMENKAIQAEYPPASTYKIITAMAGLEENVIDESTTFFCPGYYRYGNRVFRCWKRGGHGEVNVTKAIAESCDVFFYQVGQKLGVDTLAYYAKACGLGSATGIDLADGEARGLVPTRAWKKKRVGVAWQGGETLSIAIGQGYNLVTPIQMLVLTSAVANGGIIKKPLILKWIETAEGKVVYRSKSQRMGKLPATVETLEIIRKGLWEVVNKQEGTAWLVHVPGIDISGKTGTAQIVSRKTGDPGHKETEEVADSLKPHAWFVAYAPSVEPKIAVSVIVEHGEHGASSAGPIAKEVITTYIEGLSNRNDKKEKTSDQLSAQF
jgi:penicillin-binding protein 2